MNILVFDTIFPVGHKDLNEHILRILSKNHTLYVLDNNYFTRKVKADYLDVSLISNIGVGVLKNQWIHLSNIYNCYKKTKGLKYDVVLFLTFDISSFLLCMLLFWGKRKVVIHHNNPDQLMRKSKQLCFNLYKNSVTHITVSEHITDYLVRYRKVNKDLVKTLPHPIDTNRLNKKNDAIENYIGCIIVNANKVFCSMIIKQLEEIEEKEHFLKSQGLKIKIKGKGDSKSDRLEVINGYMSDEEYETFYRRAKAIIVIFPDNYMYRYSGTIKDALCFKKLVFTSNVLAAKTFNTRYPHNVICFKDIHELFSLMSLNPSFSEEDHKNFLRYHSDENVNMVLNYVLNVHTVR